MRNALTTLFVIVLTMTFTSFNSTSNNDNIEGKVVWENSRCDYYIIETNKFFVLVERYNGSIYEGDKVEGPLHSYHFKYLKNKSRSNSEVKVYIENYWSSKSDCIKWLKENNKCGV